LRDCEFDSFGSEYGPVAGCCEHGDEHFGYIKLWEFLLLNEDSAPCS